MDKGQGNSWFTGEAELTTYHFEVLLGTKLRALYQRKKGRDLFDLYIALQRKEVDVDKVLQCYKKYMEFVVDRAPSYKQFVTCRRRWKILSLPTTCNPSCAQA